MKKLLRLFGLLDIITLVRSYKHIIPRTMAWTNFPLITTAEFLLYASLIFSAYFLLRQNKVGLWLTYGQFPLRLTFVVLSFGFLFTINRLFDNHVGSYRIIFWVLVGFEILRLIFTIQIHKKYFLNTKTIMI
jgi:hypothetical protein